MIEHVVDTTDLPIPPGAILPGDTWYFQAWYRDRNPGPTSNFSAGVRLTYR